MDADAGVNHNPPTLLQMSISRESDTTTTSEISVFEDSMSPVITDRNGLNDTSEDSLYSPEERQYAKLKKVQELSVVAETTTAATNTPPQRRRPHSPRRQAHSTSKFYVDGLSNHAISGINTRKISVPARHHLPKSEKERVRKVK